MSQTIISWEQIERAAEKLGVEPCALKAVCEVESSGNGFLPSGRPKILFEGHKFWEQLKKHGLDPAALAAKHPNIIYPKWDKKQYKGGEKEHDRLNEAKSIHKEAALCSASWGTFQVMGFNYSLCGYKNVFAFVEAQEKDAESHLDACCRYITAMKLTQHLKNKNWAAFAKGYNGSGYAQNKYDQRLKTAYEKCQAALKYKYIPGDVFLFESDGSCISDLICQLSGAPVSHAALYYENNSIIEAGLAGIQTRELNELGDRPIHVMRYARAAESTNALLATEKKHEKTHDPYSIGNLIMMGVLIIAKMKCTNLPWAIQKLLGYICAKLGQYIDKKMHPGEHPMTCSQFVYNCYKEAGFPLTIMRAKSALEQEVDTNSTILETLLQQGANADDEKQIAALLMEPADTHMVATSANGSILEELSCMVLQWLKKSQAQANVQGRDEADFADEQKILQQAKLFAVLLLKISENSEDRQNLAPGGLRNALQNLQLVYDGFVSPSDLLLNCPDLTEKPTMALNL